MKKILISIAVLCAALLLSTVAVAAETEFTINGVTVTASSGTAVNNCSLYASQVLQKIWQYKGVTTTFYSNYNMLKTKTDEERKITEEHTREYIQNAPLGSRIRITHYSSKVTDNNDNNPYGHTMVLVAKDDISGTFTVLEAGWGAAADRTYTYKSFTDKWTQYKNGYDYFFYIADLTSFGTDSGPLSINPSRGGYPTGTLKQGSSFPLSGTITSNYMIKTFTGEILDSSGKSVSSASQTASTKNLTIRRSKVDMNLKFSSLPSGTYRLKYTATDASGAEVTWTSDPFEVIGQNANPVSVTEAKVIEKMASAEKKWANGSVYDDSKALCKQCFGFCRELFYHVFGVSLPTYVSQSEARLAVTYMENIVEIGHLDSGYSLNDIKGLLSKAKPGDVIVASNASKNHLAMIRSAESDGSGIHVYDANWNSENGIRTNALWTAEDIKNQRPVAVTLYRCKFYDVTPAVSYTITFDANGGSVSAENMTVTEGTVYGSLPTPTRTGYIFDGWYAEKSGGEKITADKTVSLTADQMLYAHWTACGAHTKGSYLYYGETHPHYNYYKCTACGETFADGSTSKMASCTTCNPVKEPEWSDWSDWSVSKVTESDNREVETRTVKIADARTEYRYGRYVSANGKNDCWCGTYLEGLSYVTGKAVLDYSGWTVTPYSTSGKSWSCGRCSGNHIGVDHTSSDGRSWWKEYVSPDGKSYYWEESRTVAAAYRTEYRYRDLIIP